MQHHPSTWNVRQAEAAEAVHQHPEVAAAAHPEVERPWEVPGAYPVHALRQVQAAKAHSAGAFRPSAETLSAGPA